MQAARKEAHATHHAQETKTSHEAHGKRHYMHLAGMIGAHFIVMYALMYLMVDSFADVFLNVNNFYMSGAMAAPMAILMLLFMKSMYKDPKLNLIFYLGSAVLLLAFIVFTRQQTLVGDKEFLKSMIPHHSGALLMCKKAAITDSEIKALCGQILQSQQTEINQMKNILSRLEGAQ